MVSEDIVGCSFLCKDLCIKVSWTCEHEVPDGSGSCQTKSSLVIVIDAFEVVVDGCFPYRRVPYAVSDTVGSVVPCHVLGIIPLESGNVLTEDEEDISALFFAQTVHEIQSLIELPVSEGFGSRFRIQIIPDVRSEVKVGIGVANSEDFIS